MTDDARDDEVEISEADEAEAAKFLFYRRGAPNDIRSPVGEFTAHDRLRVLVATVAMTLPKGDQLVEEMDRLSDIVEDHQRLLTVVILLREFVVDEEKRLGGVGGLVNYGKTREHLAKALGFIDTEMAKLYLPEV